MGNRDPETPSNIIVDNGIVWRLPQFTNIASRLLGEREISPNTKSEVDSAIRKKLPEIVVNAMSVAGVDGAVRLQSNEDQTMYKLGSHINAKLKDISPKANYATDNGTGTIEIVDMPIISLATAYHRGGISLMSRELDLTYEVLKAIRYHEYTTTHSEELEAIHKYAELSLDTGTHISSDAADAINWGNRGRVTSHEESMRLMEDWFTNRTKQLSGKEKLLWRVEFAAWKIFEAHATGNLLKDTNKKFFERDGTLEIEYRNILDKLALTQKAIEDNDRIMESSPMNEIT